MKRVDQTLSSSDPFPSPAGEVRLLALVEEGGMDWRLMEGVGFLGGESGATGRRDVDRLSSGTKVACW